MLLPYSILLSANASTEPFMRTQCECYTRYSTRSAFVATVIVGRQSYMGCVRYRTASRQGVTHLAVPIMLGSWLDFLIRGPAECLETRAQWGSVLIQGAYRLYPNYATFNPMSLHVRSAPRTNQRYAMVYTYVGTSGLALTYHEDGHVTYDYQGVQGRSDRGWVDLLRQSTLRRVYSQARGPLVDESEQAFRDMCAARLRESFCMNALGNKRIVNAPNVIARFVRRRLGESDPGGPSADGAPASKRRRGYSCRMNRAFETGQIFSGLGKRAVVADAENRNGGGRHTQTFDQPMHEGRSSKTAHLLATVRRDSNAAVRNSNALAFPSDAINFLCPLTTKDLKSAGEQTVLCDMVIVSERSDPIAVLDYLAEHVAVPRHETAAAAVADPAVSGYRVLVLDDQPLQLRGVWSLGRLVALKRAHPFVTTRDAGTHLFVSTSDSVPIKYEPTRKLFFSADETRQWRIKYPGLHQHSTMANELPLVTRTRTPPAKQTVSINHTKGSVATKTSETHRLLMENLLGVTCYVDPPPDYFRTLLARAELGGPGSGDTAPFEHWYGRLRAFYNLDRPTDVEAARTGDDDRRQPGWVASAMETLSGMYPAPAGADPALVAQYRAMIGTPAHYQPLEHGPWTMRLWSAFANPHGHCVEDGIVLDRAAVNALTPVHYNAFITINFTFATVSQPAAVRFYPVANVFNADGAADDATFAASSPPPASGDDATYDEYDTKPRDSLVGVLLMERPAELVKHSKHTEVKIYAMGSLYVYLVRFLPNQTNMYRDLRVRTCISSNVLSVVIMGKRRVHVNVGSKLANPYGQKNIVSHIMDMRPYAGVTRDGRVVHAQIMYSDVSILSRVTVGQLYAMLTSPDLAIGPSGELIVPIELTLHVLNPYSNHKLMTLRADTFTNMFGFDAHGLTMTSHLLRKESVYERMMDLVGLHGYQCTFQDRATAPRAMNELLAEMHSAGYYCTADDLLSCVDVEPPEVGASTCTIVDASNDGGVVADKTAAGAVAANDSAVAAVGAVVPAGNDDECDVADVDARAETDGIERREYDDAIAVETDGLEDDDDDGADEGDDDGDGVDGGGGGVDDDVDVTEKEDDDSFGDDRPEDVDDADDDDDDDDRFSY